MPYTFLIDWTTLALGVFGLGHIALIHGTVVLMWSITLQMIGLVQVARVTWQSGSGAPP